MEDKASDEMRKGNYFMSVFLFPRILPQKFGSMVKCNQQYCDLLLCHVTCHYSSPGPRPICFAMDLLQILAEDEN